jgi:hypothetical protein
MPCSKCGTDGHNVRTCKWKKTKKTKKSCESRPILKREIKDCCVCYEQLDSGNGSVKTPCGHNYCTNCFVTWMRKSGTCAYCREEICEVPSVKNQPINEEAESQIIDELLESDVLVTDFEKDIREQIVRGIYDRYGRNAAGVDSMVGAIDDIMNNFEPYFIMSIVAHETMYIVSEHYEE